MALTLKEVNGTLEYVDEQGKPCTVNAELIGGASPDYPLAQMFSARDFMGRGDVTV